MCFFFSSRRRHTRCALVTGVQTCALPISDGVVRFSQLRLTAPLLRVTGGQGSYSPDGRIRLAARATSRDYGPLGVEVAGTISDPRAILRAERPGLGIGLVDLEARLTGAAGGYRPAATGGTDYGPLSARSEEHTS